MYRKTSALLLAGCCAVALASDPASHDVAVPSAPGTVVVEWTGTVIAGANATNECSLPTGVVTDDAHTINLTVPDGVYSTLEVQAVFRIEWADAAQDLILTLNKDDALVDSSDGGAPNEEITVQDPQAGAFTAIACPFAASADTPYTGRLTLIATVRGAGDGGPPSPPPGIPDAPATAPRYIVYTPPTPLGETSGEPSVGYNLETHRVMYISGLQTLRATFPENLVEVQPEACEADWEDKSFVFTSTSSLDPILYTDQTTGRTFVSQLRSQVPPAGGVLIGANSYFAFTDDDGESWTPGQLDPTNGSYDHQSVGAGPYPASVPLGTPLNKNSAVYYCAQTGYVSECARSDNGGVSFNPPSLMYNFTECGGIHGHIRVAPDGTVFVPNRGCGSNQALVVSEDAGSTWEIRKVPTSGLAPAILDPSYAIGSDNNTGYFCYIQDDGHPHVAVTHDKGLTWVSDTDVGEQLGLQNAVFTEAIAGDPDRAVCGFIGTTSEGNHEALDFPGVWYLFMAHTFDGGATWTTVNATPGDPVQHAGGIWNQGGGSLNRNLLDFNEITLDEKGRAIYAFADGCVGTCVPDGPNSYTEKANIVRQSGGQPLYAAHDVDFPQPIAPKNACLAGRRDDLGAYLKWRKPDSGGSKITAYQVYRSTSADGAYEQIGQTRGAAMFNDRGADPAVEQYFYKVVTVNDRGTSDFSNTIALLVGPRPVTDGPCVLPGVQVVTAPTGDATYPSDAFDITAVSVAEPPDKLEGKLVFTLKVVDLSSVPPGWRWTVRFLPPTVPEGQEDYYVSMISTDGAAPSFSYGTTTTQVAGQDAPGRIFNPLGTLDEGSGFTADGNITFVIDKAKIGSPMPGDGMANIFGSVRASGPSPLPGTGGTNETIADSTSGGSYVFRTPDFCLPNTAPIARLLASVSSGAAPLLVHFDATASSDDDSVDSIESYAFNFGDGTEEVEQASPRIDHTYEKNGTYSAQVVVKDSRGKVSSNAAKTIITVGGAAVTAPGVPTTGPVDGSRFGGALGLLLLGPLAGLALLRRRRLT
ncbi:MAG TPA: PKD domain-containing protein [Candidatus Binatia bacterium]|nr:PKD domain-containing protein [Candidatus Binatia bacterium]